jgi:UDP-N-acetylglucosamine pyrophosphorylase
MDQNKLDQINSALSIMQRRGEPTLALRQYARTYGEVLRGQSGYLSEADINAVKDLPLFKDFSAAEINSFTQTGQTGLSRAVIFIGNGGLATGMPANPQGDAKVKNLLEVKPYITFFDVRVAQSETGGYGITYMNSPNTAASTDDYMRREHSDFEYDSFTQGNYLKVNNEADYTPKTGNSEKDFNPGGTGAFYTSILTEKRIDASGKEVSLLDYWIDTLGLEWGFFVNGDNLCANLDPTLLGYFMQRYEKTGASMLMEVCIRTPNDKKGGHLVLSRVDGKMVLTLRETAMVDPTDIDVRSLPANLADKFLDAAGNLRDKETVLKALNELTKAEKEQIHTMGEDIELYKFFNSNNLWFHLPTLRDTLNKYTGVVPLAIVKNVKGEVVQLETVIGTIISLMPNAEAVVVGKERFGPSKKFRELFLLRSDSYILQENGEFRINPAHQQADGTYKLPVVDLDEKYFGNEIDFNKRTDIKNMPSLVNASSLTVKGDVRFGPGVVLAGEVIIDNPSNKPLYLENIKIGFVGSRTAVSFDGEKITKSQGKN